MCKYISVNTVGCRNTIENKVCSALLTTTSLSYCQYFSDSTRSALYHPHMSVTYLSHPCFLSKTVFLPQCSYQNRLFVIVVTDLLFPLILHRSVCKGKACFTLTTRLGHQWVWPPFWSLSRYAFLWTSMCQNWSLDDKMQTGAGNWFPASVLWVFMVWNISFGNGVQWYLWSLNHQYLCNFYVLIFKKVKDQWIKYYLNSVILLCLNLKSVVKQNTKMKSCIDHIQPVQANNV